MKSADLRMRSQTKPTVTQLLKAPDHSHCRPEVEILIVFHHARKKSTKFTLNLSQFCYENYDEVIHISGMFQLGMGAFKSLLQVLADSFPHHLVDGYTSTRTA